MLVCIKAIPTTFHCICTPTIFHIACPSLYPLLHPILIASITIPVHFYSCTVSICLSFPPFYYYKNTHCFNQEMQTSGSFLRQLSGRRSTSWRWSTNSNKYTIVEDFDTYSTTGCETSNLKQMGGNYMYGNNYDNNGSELVLRKRVMVVVDQTSHSKHAMIWALTHVANKGDLLTLLHIIPPAHNTSSERPSGSDSYSPYLASSLGSLCKASRPEVEVEALVIQGPKLATVMSQVKKLEVSVLVLGQKRPSALISCLCGSSSSENFVEQCINHVECWTIGVRKQSKGVNGYLITTRRQKDFWLLA